MRKKKENKLFLQHKLPWESDWNDVETGNAIECEGFMKILGSEPLHLVETEYRIVQKKVADLRNKNKSVVYPAEIVSGSEIVKKIRELKQRNN